MSGQNFNDSPQMWTAFYFVAGPRFIGSNNTQYGLRGETDMTSIFKIVFRNFFFLFQTIFKTMKHFDIQTSFSVQQTHCFAISVTCRKRSCISENCELRTP